MKTGVIGLLILGIIRTCLGFYILMLALPKDSIQNMFILGQRAKSCVHDATNGISTA
jgi:hypothetical protein